MIFKVTGFLQSFLRFDHHKKKDYFKNIALLYNYLKKIFLRSMYFIKSDFGDNGKYDVLLIYPKSESNDDIILPNSLLAIAGPLVKNNYKVKLIIQRLERNCCHHIDRILEKNAICVGITFCTGNQIQYACELMDYIKEKYPNIKIVVGGIHATILPEQTIEYENIDILVAGEGEETFLNLVNSISEDGNLSEVKGIYYKKNGEIIKTKPADPVDLNEHWHQPYSLFKQYKYFYPASTVLTSRGCPSKCGYCAVSLINSRWKSLTPNIVIKIIKERLNLGLRNIFFIDDNFFVDLKRVEEVVEMIIREDLKFRWWAECRVDYIIRMDQKFINKLARSGLTRLYIGAESGSDRILRMINKNIHADMIREVNLKLKESNIIPEYTFMTGFPTETLPEFQKTKDLIKGLISDNPKAKIWKLNCYTPYPGTALFDLAVQEGFVPPKKLKEWVNISFYRKEYQDVVFDYKV